MSRGVLGTVSELEDASNFHSKSGPNSGSARAARSTGDDMRLATAIKAALKTRRVSVDQRWDVRQIRSMCENRNWMAMEMDGNSLIVTDIY